MPPLLPLSFSDVPRLRAFKATFPFSVVPPLLTSRPSHVCEVFSLCPCCLSMSFPSTLLTISLTTCQSSHEFTCLFLNICFPLHLCSCCPGCQLLRPSILYGIHLPSKVTPKHSTLSSLPFWKQLLLWASLLTFIFSPCHSLTELSPHFPQATISTPHPLAPPTFPKCLDCFTSTVFFLGFLMPLFHYCEKNT